MLEGQELARCQALNQAMQDFLRAWSAVSARRNLPGMLDQANLPWFAELNRSLNDTLDTSAFVQRIRDSHDQLFALAREILTQACQDHPVLDGEALKALLATQVPTVAPDRMLPALAD